MEGGEDTAALEADCKAKDIQIAALRREIEMQASALRRLADDSASLEEKLSASRKKAAVNARAVESLTRKVARYSARIAKLKRVKDRLCDRLAECRRRSLSGRLGQMARACLPYGAVCAWDRMVHGSGNEDPLSCCCGFGGRLRRAVKFSLPYGLVRIACRRRRRGDTT